MIWMKLCRVNHLNMDQIARVRAWIQGLHGVGLSQLGWTQPEPRATRNTLDASTNREERLRMV